MNLYDDMSLKVRKYTIRYSIIILSLVLLWIFFPLRIVPSGYIGVLTVFGKISKSPRQPGLHIILPIVMNIHKLDTRLKSYEVQASAASKDLQIVNTVISVQHSLNPLNAPQSFAAIGDLNQFDITVVSPSVLESLKAVTARYTAEELITKRHVVKEETSTAIQDFINHTVDDKGISGALHISNVAIKDFVFSQDFNASIEAKVKALQDSLRAKNEKERRITEAEAGAREKELAADADAYQIEKLSIQRASAIERESKALSQNPLLIQLRAIEKWQGNVPQFVGGGQPVPFVDIERFGK